MSIKGIQNNDLISNKYMKQKIQIPESLREIKLEQYQKFVKLITDNPDSVFTRQKTVAILCGIDMEFVRTIKQHSIDDIYTDLLKLFETKCDLVDRFKINDVEFGLIPNFDNITAGEFADMEDYFQDIQNWHRLAAILYRPIEHRLKNLYDIEKYEGTDKHCDKMLDVPVSIILGAYVFFYNLGRELLTATMDYLQELPQAEKEIIVEKLSLLKSTDGITVSMHSLEEMCSELMTPPNLIYIPH